MTITSYIPVPSLAFDESTKLLGVTVVGGGASVACAETESDFV